MLAPSEITREIVGTALNFVVHSKARAVANEGFNYSILVVLLGLQYMQCNPIKIQNDDGNTEVSFQIGACEKDSILDFENRLLSKGVMAAAIVALLYGVFLSIVTALHAFMFMSKEENVTKPSKVEQIYEFTSKFYLFGLDSLLEIPISFIFAPVMTVLLWAIFCGFGIGFYFVFLDYHSELEDAASENAVTVFALSSFLVVISLLKLTGEILQYYVIYKVAKSDESTSQTNIERIRKCFPCCKRKDSEQRHELVQSPDENSKA